MSVVKMPEKFKGKFLGKAGGNLSQQREWTDKEIKWVMELKKAGYSIEDISKSIDRSVVSVSLKIKRLTSMGHSFYSHLMILRR